MFNACVITVSDKGYAGTREDIGGPAIISMLRDNGYEVIETLTVPDEIEMIQNDIIRVADSKTVNLIVTTGGTGFSKRDVTPEATIAACPRLAPGIAEAMRFASMKITPKGMLSRAAAGIRGETLVINLPGSPKAARECLEAVLPALEHGLEILTGRSGECAVPSQK